MARQPLLLMLALVGFRWGQLTAGARPPMDVVCCPATKLYLETPRAPTALMSFPGSGNTWARHIIETLTGYHTTSVYCDRALEPVFKAECDLSSHYNRSIVVKTHKLAHCSMWGRAVVIIRDPLHAIRGEYQRLRSHSHSHTGYVDPQDWDWSEWSKASTRMCATWTRAFARVLGSEGQPGCAGQPSSQYKVFFYEDLKTKSGDLNPYFLDELLAWFNIDKAESFYDCALRFHKGSFARQLPADHPAAKVLIDTETLKRFWGAGCTAAFKYYRSKFPHLPQPMPNNVTIVHKGQKH